MGIKEEFICVLCGKYDLTNKYVMSISIMKYNPTQFLAYENAEHEILIEHLCSDCLNKIKNIIEQEAQNGC